MSPTVFESRAEPDALSQRVRATWTAGDFGRIATTYTASAAEFVARLGISDGERVIDVACGTGNLALPAARRGASVVGVDIAPNLIEQARAAAAAEDLRVRFEEGDCESLAYGDDSFDYAITMFGVMFAARPERAAAELMRVVRPGGTIAMASWTPTGFIGQMFRITAAMVPPAPGVPSPLLWGDEAVVRQRLTGVSSIKTERRHATFELPFEPAAVVEQFRAYYGPTLRAFDGLDAGGRARLRQGLADLWAEHNRATDGTTRVESEYLEVVARV